MLPPIGKTGMLPPYRPDRVPIDPRTIHNISKSSPVYYYPSTDRCFADKRTNPQLLLTWPSGLCEAFSHETDFSLVLRRPTTRTESNVAKLKAFIFQTLKAYCSVAQASMQCLPNSILCQRVTTTCQCWTNLRNKGLKLEAWQTIWLYQNSELDNNHTSPLGGTRWQLLNNCLGHGP